MGKGLSDASMVALNTQHPNVVVAHLQHHTASAIQALCLSVDSGCKFQEGPSPDQLCCIPPLLKTVYKILERLGQEGVTTSLQSHLAIVDNQLDILASLENFMGTEGKAPILASREL